MVHGHLYAPQLPNSPHLMTPVPGYWDVNLSLSTGADYTCHRGVSNSGFEAWPLIDAFASTHILCSDFEQAETVRL